ncbi:hypothetical protein ElyMa_004800500 [Elysia marginata]|uniref:Uncharacterized protein n=1 Tax=Elysia marginata TaxID=1093978 RepID=A0AAV4II83_9GAST|nr:hypothetical protein ElyMa_004800500 [Elysia marginata]
MFAFFSKTIKTTLHSIQNKIQINLNLISFLLSPLDPLLDDAAIAVGAVDAESLFGPSNNFAADGGEDVLPREMEDEEDEEISKVETIPDDMIGIGFPDKEADINENEERVENDDAQNADKEVQVDKKMTDDGIEDTEEGRHPKQSDGLGLLPVLGTQGRHRELWDSSYPRGRNGILGTPQISQDSRIGEKIFTSRAEASLSIHVF